MNTRLLEIFEESKQDTYALTINSHGYESRMVYGIKIIKDNETNEIQFLNTMLRPNKYFYRKWLEVWGLCLIFV